MGAGPLLARLLRFAAHVMGACGCACCPQTLPRGPSLPDPRTGWFVAAALLDGYGRAARGGAVGPAAAAAAKVWALGAPLGLVIRGVAKGYVPPKPFVIVSLAATLVLMVGWRAALAAATPEVRGARAGEG